VSTPSAATSARDVVRTVAPELIDVTGKVVDGGVRERPGLSRRDRSRITVAALLAMSPPMALSAGWPTAMTAGRSARQVLDEVKA
jgi:4-carboxymuconolactone decarboxylase